MPPILLAYQHYTTSALTYPTPTATQVTQVFKIMGCDDRQIRKKLGGERGCLPATVKYYIGLIEHKTNDFMKIIYYVHMRVGGASSAGGVVYS